MITPHITDSQLEQIQATSSKIASAVIISLKLPESEREDIVQSLILAALKAALTYKEGSNSRMSFITERLYQAKVDLLRSYLASKRRLFLLCEREFQKDRDEPLLESFADDSTYCDVIGHAEAASMLEKLSSPEKRLAQLTADGFSLTQAASALGIEVWAAKEMMRKIRKKLKKFSPVFRTLYEK